jgi:hypothetical protein
MPFATQRNHTRGQRVPFIGIRSGPPNGVGEAGKQQRGQLPCPAANGYGRPFSPAGRFAAHQNVLSIRTRMCPIVTACVKSGDASCYAPQPWSVSPGQSNDGTDPAASM